MQVNFLFQSFNSRVAIANMSEVIPPGGTQPLIVRHATQPKPHEIAAPSPMGSSPVSSSSRRSRNNSDPELPQTEDHQDLIDDVPHLGLSQSHQQPGMIPASRGVHPIPPSSHSVPPPHLTFPAPTIIAPSPRLDPAQQSTHYLVYVTIDNVPSSFDLMSFIFLANYGQVIEGKAETQDIQFIHSDGLPYLYRTYTGVYCFTLLIDKDKDVSNLVGLNMAMVAIEGHLLQVKRFSHFWPDFIQ
jgi:hypothetical protein